MQRLEVSGAVRPLYGSLGVKELIKRPQYIISHHVVFNSKLVKKIIYEDIIYTSFSSEHLPFCISRISLFQSLNRRLAIVRENFHCFSQTCQTNASITLQAGLRPSLSNHLSSNPILELNTGAHGGTVV